MGPSPGWLTGKRWADLALWIPTLFLVWVFAVSPRRQRSGLGRRLMTQALDRAEDAEVPAYLWTANPANVPYYRSHGFETFAEADIPGPVKNWFMERPAN